ncbi:hypothetical protein AALF15_01415 [Corynebacteriaceae bacterium 7-707]
MSIRHEMVTGHWTLLVEDGIQDEDHQLDEVPLQGTATFTPVWPEGMTAGRASDPTRLVSAKPIKALVADGELVSLSGTVSEIGDVPGGPGQELPVWIGDTPLWWRVDFSVHYNGTPVKLPRLLVDATDGPVDLSTLVSASGMPPVDTSEIEGIIATVKSISRDAEKAIRRAEEAAEGADELNRRIEAAVKEAEDFVGQVQGLVDDAEGIRDNAAEIRNEVHGWYEALSADTKLIIDAVNGHLDDLAGDVAADASRAKQEADRAGEAARVEVDRIKGDAPEAFDTLEEIAAWITDAEDAAGGLIRSIAEKADKDHTHDVDDIDGLKALLDEKVTTSNLGTRVYGTNAGGNQAMLSYSSGPNASTLAYRGTGGTLQVGSPTDDAHATTRGWVQSRVDEVAETVPVIVVVDEHPADPDPDTIYLVRE